MAPLGGEALENLPRGEIFPDMALYYRTRPWD